MPRETTILVLLSPQMPVKMLNNGNGNGIGFIFSVLCVCQYENEMFCNINSNTIDKLIQSFFSTTISPIKLTKW